jgi:hypothetical protein
MESNTPIVFRRSRTPNNAFPGFWSPTPYDENDPSRDGAPVVIWKEKKKWYIRAWRKVKKVVVESFHVIDDRLIEGAMGRR